jgi:hypothetical protein
VRVSRSDAARRALQPKRGEGIATFPVESSPDPGASTSGKGSEANMNKSFLWTGVAATGLVTAWIGCGPSNLGSGSPGATATSSSTGTTTPAGSTGTGGTMGTTSTSASTGAGGMGIGGTGAGGTSANGGAGGADVNPFECTVPASPHSGGSCVTTVAANDAGTGIECNPVTNEGCAAGDNCDANTDSNGNLIGFVCYSGDTQTVCQSCAQSDLCAVGTTCFTLDSTGTEAVCAQYCCTDADCGAGKCSITLQGTTLFGPLAPNLGVCTTM